MTTRAERHARAALTLVADLAEAIDSGHVIPCLDADDDQRHWWTSDDTEEQEAAAHRCLACPCTARCREVGTLADAGVWGCGTGNANPMEPTNLMEARNG